MAVSYTQPNLEGDGNVLLTPLMIANEALRLLKNNLVAAGLVNRNVEQEFKKVGDTVYMKRPFRTKVADGRTFVKQPMVDQTVPVVIDKQHHVGFNYTVDDLALSLKQFGERYLKSGMIALAHKIDKTILDAIWYGGFYGSGSPGTALTTDVFTDARALMEMVGVPMDDMISGVYSPLDRAAVTKDLKDSPAEKFAGAAILRNYDGRISEFDMYSTAQIGVHLVGTHGGTPLMNGANQVGNSLVTDGWTASTLVLRKGDTFTINGVYEVNPQTYESTGRLQRFVVQSNVTSDGSGNATITVMPGINSGAQTTLDALGASISTAAYQNVNALNAENAPITVIGNSATQYRRGMLFHRDSTCLAMVNLPPPQTAVKATMVQDPETGLALTMTGFFDGNNYEENWRIDVLYGVSVVYGELIHKLYSAAG